MQFPDLLLIVESGHTTLALPFQTQLFPAVTVAAENLSSWELTDRGSGGGRTSQGDWEEAISERGDPEATRRGNSLSRREWLTLRCC